MNLLLIAAVAVFNLNCAGTVITNRSASKPFAKTFRVDLDAGRWCENDCPRSFPLFAISDDTLTFQMKMDEISNITEEVDRQSGEYTANGKVFSTSMEWHGKCTRTAFTGLPALRQKF